MGAWWGAGCWGIPALGGRVLGNSCACSLPPSLASPFPSPCILADPTPAPLSPRSFTPGEKVDASCTGPSVTIAVVPKVCVLEAATKQVVCDPAKLVLTKAPGSCVHKYKTASVWEGKSCKISGGAGFSDEVVIGGGQRVIPLTQIDFSYEV